MSSDDEDEYNPEDNGSITIFFKKRNNKQGDTAVYGMANDLDLKKILSYLKKKHSCGGSITIDKKFGEVMTLTGEQSENVYNFLVNQEICRKDQIIIKGI
jgi:translation initiation factor SUI1